VKPLVDGAVGCLGIDAAHIDVKRQLDTNALEASAIRSSMLVPARGRGGVPPGWFAYFDQSGCLSIGQGHRVAYVSCHPSIREAPHTVLI